MFFVCEKKANASIAFFSQTKKLQISLKLFFVAGTGLEPVTKTLASITLQLYNKN